MARKQIGQCVQRLLVLALLVGGLAGCKDGARGKNIMPGVTGKSGEVLVVINKDVENSALGQQLIAALSAEYPMLPQSEPYFQAIPVPSGAFTSVFKLHRNIVFVHVSPEYTQPRMVRQLDGWASPQTIVNVLGNNLDTMAAYVAQHADRLRDVFEQAEVDRNVANIKKYEVIDLRKQVKERFGFEMYFPQGYTMQRTPDPDFMWVTYNTNKMDQGVFIYTYPYNGSTLPGLDRVLAERNRMLQKNVPGTAPGSYMTTYTEEMPLYSQGRLKDRPYAQVRGLWEVANDFMGGPFLSYSFLDKERGRVVCLECFLYAPDSDKRIYLRQVESVLLTTEF